MKFATMLAERDDLTGSLARKLIDYDMENPKSNNDLTKTLINKTGSKNNLNIRINDLKTKVLGGKRSGKINDMERYAFKHINWDYDELKTSYGSMLQYDPDTRVAALKSAASECPKGVGKISYVNMLDDTATLTRHQKEALQGKLQSYRDNVAYISNLDYRDDSDLAVAWANAHKGKASWGEFHDDVAIRVANTQPVSPAVLKAAGYSSYDSAMIRFKEYSSMPEDRDDN